MPSILDLCFTLSSSQFIMGKCVHIPNPYEQKWQWCLPLHWQCWMWTSGEKRSELTASTRPFTVGVFSMRASNTSSVSLRTYSKTAKAEKCGHLYGHSCANCKPSFLETKINQKVKSKSFANTFMWQMIWYVFLKHAINDFISHDVPCSWSCCSCL